MRGTSRLFLDPVSHPPRQLTSGQFWRALQSVQLPRFDAADLEAEGIRTAHAALRAVRSQVLRELCPLDWAASNQALDAFVGAADGHCFDVEPHAWLALLEPQITKGLAHFLNAGDSANRNRRILALLQAIRSAGAPLLELAPEQVTSARAVAEGPCLGGRRIDLIAWVQLNDGRRVGTVIEAKVGHHLTDGQLAAYEGAAAEPPYRLDARGTRFLIVAPSLTPDTQKQLRRHPRWSFIAWRVLLTRLGSALANDNCDHDDFMRFRRTVWNCAA